MQIWEMLFTQLKHFVNVNINQTLGYSLWAIIFSKFVILPFIFDFRWKLMSFSEMELLLSIISAILDNASYLINFSIHFHFIYLRILLLLRCNKMWFTKALKPSLCQTNYFSGDTFNFHAKMYMLLIYCWYTSNKNLERILKATDLSILIFLSAGLISLYAQIQSWWRDKGPKIYS